MGLFSFIEDAVDSVADVVSDVVDDVSGAVDAVSGGAFGGILDTVGGIADSLGGFKGIGTIAGTFFGGPVGSAIGGAVGGFLDGGLPDDPWDLVASTIDIASDVLPLGPVADIAGGLMGGGSFLDGVTSAVKGVAGELVDDFGGSFGDLAGGALGTLLGDGGPGELLSSTLGGLADSIGLPSDVVNFVGESIGDLGGGLDAIGDVVAPLLGGGGMVGGLQDTFEDALGVGNLGGIVSGLAGAATDAASDLAEGVLGNVGHAAASAVEGAVGAVRTAVEGIDDIDDVGDMVMGGAGAAMASSARQVTMSRGDLTADGSADVGAGDMSERGADDDLGLDGGAVLSRSSGRADTSGGDTGVTSDPMDDDGSGVMGRIADRLPDNNDFEAGAATDDMLDASPTALVEPEPESDFARSIDAADDVADSMDKLFGDLDE